MASDGSRRNPVKTYVVCITSTGYALYHAVGLDPYQSNKDSFLQSVRGDLSSFLSVMKLLDSHDFQSEAEFCEEKRALSDPDEIFDEAYDLGHFLNCCADESIELGVFAPHITEFLKEFADVPACVFNEFYLEVSKCAGRNYDKYIDKYDPSKRDRPVKYGLPLLGYGEYSGGGGIVWYRLARSSHGRTSKSEKKEKQGLMVLAEESHEGKEKKMKKAEKKRKRKEEEEEKTQDEEVHNVKSEKKEKRKLAKCSHGRTSESEKKEKKLQYRKEIAKRERSQQKLVTQGLMMVLAEESQEFDKGKEKKMKKAEKKRKRKEEEEKTQDEEVHNVKSEKKEKRKLAKCSHGRTTESEKKEKKLQYRKEIAKRERSQQKLVTQGLMGKEKKMKRKEEEEKTHDKEIHNVKSEKKRKLAKCSHGRTSKSKKKKKLRKLERS